MMRFMAICAAVVVLGGAASLLLGADGPTSRKSDPGSVGRYNAVSIGEGKVVLIDTQTGEHYIKNYGSLIGGPYEFK